MKKRRIASRVLYWAIGGSLAIHLVAALGIHRLPVVDAKDEVLGHLQIMPVKIIHTPPPPTPKPVQTPRAAQDARPSHVAVQPPTQHSQPNPGPVEPPAPPATPGGTDVIPNVDGTGSPLPPAPTPTPRPACSDPNIPAKAVNPITPPVPEDAAGSSGTAQVQVTLNASGGVEAASVYKSTGNLSLDRAAVRAARGSEYKPELRDCLPVRGTYLFTVEFQE